MKKYFPYEPAAPADVESEEHVIIGGQIRLDHIPTEGSLAIRGFVEASNAANLQSNEFYCNYRKDTLYRESNRIVYFYRGRSGQTVYASYKAAGSPVTADDMNEIRDFMLNTNRHLDNSDTTQSNLAAQITAVKNEARTSLVTHNLSQDAHPDLHDAITNENRARREADSSLQSQITALNNSQNIIGDNLEEEIAARKLADTGLRNLLDNETIARISGDNRLDERIEHITLSFDRQFFLDYVFGTGTFTAADIAAIFLDDADEPEDTPFTADDLLFVFRE